MAGNTATIQAVPKAYDLLAAQPVSAKGLSDPDRSGIVVSAVVDLDGSSHVLSVFGDAIWDFRPYFEQSNVADGQKYIPWPEDCAQELVEDCKAVLYAWFKRGLPGSKASFHRLARMAGTDWLLTPHQCRRTYARNIVESRMGRASLVFLKWQFKHSSISMTQLYASNPMQDASLFDEVLEEMTEFKVDLIESWLGEQPLSGGAGHEIKKARVIALKSRSALLSETAAQVHIRATGHGWCLAQEKGCGGAGLYEATRCVGCKNGVIDESFVEIWKGIYAQQTELLAIDDAGPAVKQRAERDVQWARQVMVDLGVLPKTPDAPDMNGASHE